MSEPILWEWMTTDEIGNLCESGMNMAILPVGSTEQHGPHLTVNVDSLSAYSVAMGVSARTGVPVLPCLPYGSAWGHTHKWPGTLSLSPTTLTAAVVEIGEWLLLGARFSKLLILSGHVTNHAALRTALETLRYRYPQMSVALRGVWEISPRVAQIYSSDAADWHANAAETSLMMAIHPRGVRSDKIIDDEDRTEGLFFSYPVDRTSRYGATGKPSRATLESGAKLLSFAVEDLAQQVQAALNEQPPF